MMSDSTIAPTTSAVITPPRQRSDIERLCLVAGSGCPNVELHPASATAAAALSTAQTRNRPPDRIERGGYRDCGGAAGTESAMGGWCAARTRTMTTDPVNLTGYVNFRDLGGHATPNGKVRTGH